MMLPIEVARAIVKRSAISLPEEDLAMLASILECRTATKGTVLLNEGDIAREFIFIEQGLIRQFYYKNNIDVTEHFSCEGGMCFSVESLLTGQPSMQMLEALEKVVYHVIPLDKLRELFDRSRGIIRLYCSILERSLIISQRKADANRFESARERYELFCKQYPEAAKRASGRHIASYLLMSPESLSRVRAGLL